MSLDELTKDAEFVGIVTVEHVSKPLFGKRNAVATVNETWKGTPLQRVHFLAEPTWTCDISTAATGERMLLFLVRPERARLLHIAHSGRGRMPLRELHQQTYATVWDDIQLPREVRTIPGPDPQSSWIVSAELNRIRHHVIKATKAATHKK